MLMMSPAPPIQDERRHAAALMAWILGNSDGSRLYWSLIETGKAEAQAQYDGRDRSGQFLTWCICDPEKADEIETVIRQEIADLVQSISEDDLERVLGQGRHGDNASWRTTSWSNAETGQTVHDPGRLDTS